MVVFVPEAIVANTKRRRREDRGAKGDDWVRSGEGCPLPRGPQKKIIYLLHEMVHFTRSFGANVSLHENLSRNSQGTIYKIVQKIDIFSQPSPHVHHFRHKSPL